MCSPIGTSCRRANLRDLINTPRQDSRPIPRVATTRQPSVRICLFQDRLEMYAQKQNNGIIRTGVCVCVWYHRWGIEYLWWCVCVCVCVWCVVCDTFLTTQYGLPHYMAVYPYQGYGRMSLISLRVKESLDIFYALWVG